ncbi:MAG TPA: hypothetical protein VF808_14715 [Ktedonobacterales bacterium]
MSGYRRSNSPEHPERPDGQEAQDAGLLWPADFTLEEQQFAKELRELFPIEEEILPPLYVQTLLDDDLRAPLRKGYTRRLISHVMRRLDLPRTLTPPRSGLRRLEGLTLRAVTEPVRRAGAPVIAAFSLLMALVIGSVYLATPSFAEGLRLLLGQTGAQQLTKYPTVTALPRQHARQSTPNASMPLFWLGLVYDNYSFLGMSQNDQQDWSNGPVIDIQYLLTAPPQQSQPATASAQSATSAKTDATTQGGSGLLDIREFQISSADSAVLLAVRDGSATMTSVNGQSAVYVDGMWTQAHGGLKTWQSGTRSMLIFERQGVIFWITGDQRDGLTSYALTQIAAGLIPTSLSALRPNRLTARFGSGAPDADLRASLGANTDVLEVIAHGDGSDAPASTFVTLNLPAPTP